MRRLHGVVVEGLAVAALLAGWNAPLVASEPSALFRPTAPAVVPASPVRRSQAEGVVRPSSVGDRLMIDGESGLLVVPIGADCTALAPGTPVRVVSAAQAVTIAVVEPEADRQSPAFTPPVPSEPEGYSTAIGRLLAVAPDGRLTVDAPGTPITVPSPPAGWRVGGLVQVWTLIDMPRGCNEDVLPRVRQ